MKNAGSIQNSLSRLERCGYIHRDFFDEARKKRKVIVPLMDRYGLSLANDTVLPSNDTGLSLDNDQRYCSPKNRKSEGKMDSHSIDFLKDSSVEEGRPKSDPAAEGLIKVLCEEADIKRPDRSLGENIVQARQLIGLLVEKMGGKEDEAIWCAKGLIKRIVKYGDGKGYDKINLTRIKYLVSHFNRLFNEYGPKYRSSEDCWGFEDPV